MGHQPHTDTDYDRYAPTYARVRSAVEWVTNPLAETIQDLKDGSRVLEIGCGTANYAVALAARFPRLGFLGLDRSVPMLREAASRQAPSICSRSRSWGGVSRGVKFASEIPLGSLRSAPLLVKWSSSASVTCASCHDWHLCATRSRGIEELSGFWAWSWLKMLRIRSLASSSTS